MAKNSKKNKEQQHNPDKKRGRGRPPKKTTVEEPISQTDELTDELLSEGKESHHAVDPNTEIMDVPQIAEISPYGGEPQVQSYALPPGHEQTAAIPEGGGHTEEPQPNFTSADPATDNSQSINTGFAQQDEATSAEQDAFNSEKQEAPFTGQISDDEARQTYEAIREQYNFAVSNLLPEIPGLAVKPGKDLYQLDEPTQESFLSYIQAFNSQCFDSLKINDEDNKMLEEPSIYMIKKQASKITMEDRFKMALAQIGAKKLALLIGIIRQAKSVNAQINERIRQAVLERKVDLNRMEEMMDSFNSRMAEFSAKEEKFNSEMAEFKSQKEKWEQEKGKAA